MELVIPFALGFVGALALFALRDRRRRPPALSSRDVQRRIERPPMATHAVGREIGRDQAGTSQRRSPAGDPWRSRR